MSYYEKGKKGLSSYGRKLYESSSLAQTYKDLDKQIREIELDKKQTDKKYESLIKRMSKRKGGRVKKK
jgi:hypothetical protein